MLTIGGTYLERCAEPEYREVYGSALRAAAVLAPVSRGCIYTCLDAQLRPVAEATAAAFGLQINAVAREKPVAFSYYTPLGTPTIDGLSQPPQTLRVHEPNENALVYGMLEADADVIAAAIVYDPQRPRGPAVIDRGRLAAPRFGVVANSAEIAALGLTDDVRVAAQRVLATTGAEVVVVKRGPRGALVIEGNGQATPIGPYRTERVWPLGSGDVFSAAFAWAWLEDGRAPVEAAQLASAATAAWCGFQSLAFGLATGIAPEALGHGIALAPREEVVPVYLAGPFFDIGERWLVALIRDALQGHGAQVFSPLHDVGLGGDEVASKAIAGLDGSKTVMGLLNGADAGTLFELGYAAARGIPVVGYAENPDNADYKMLRGLGAFVTNDLSTAVYHAIWAGMEAQ